MKNLRLNLTNAIIGTAAAVVLVAVMARRPDADLSRTAYRRRQAESEWRLAGHEHGQLGHPATCCVRRPRGVARRAIFGSGWSGSDMARDYRIYPRRPPNRKRISLTDSDS